MKKPLAVILTLLVVAALLPLNSVYAQMSARTDEPITEPSVISKNRIGRTDKEALRVIFLAGSTYDNFRIGMENQSKSAVNIEVTDEKGAVVFTDRMRRVSKRVKELDFSFLKRGEYVVRVFNYDNEFSRVLQVP
jgi:hypothetical protein